MLDPAKAAPRCAYCGCRGAMTKDHIIPKRTGATLVLPGGIRNWRWSCLPCNNYREHCGDCPAVAAMARGVARDARMKTRHVLAAWGFIGGKLKREHGRMKLAAAGPLRASARPARMEGAANA